MGRYHGFYHRDKEDHLGYWWKEHDSGFVELVFNQYDRLIEGTKTWGISKSWVDSCSEYRVLDDLPDEVHVALALRALTGIE